MQAEMYRKTKKKKDKKHNSKALRNIHKKCSEPVGDQRRAACKDAGVQRMHPNP